MRRKVLMFSLAFVVAGVVAVGVAGGIPAKADNQKVAKEELFPSETIKVISPFFVQLLLKDM